MRKIISLGQVTLMSVSELELDATQIRKASVSARVQTAAMFRLFQMAKPRGRVGEKWDGTHFARLIVHFFKRSAEKEPMSGRRM